MTWRTDSFPRNALTPQAGFVMCLALILASESSDRLAGILELLLLCLLAGIIIWPPTLWNQSFWGHKALAETLWIWSLDILT